MIDPSFATRRRLEVGLIIAGLCSGAIVGAVLTYVGKIVAGAPPATLRNYLINMEVFGAVGAVLTPVITWSALRNVPLWRTVLEPLAVGIAGAVVGMLIGSGVAFLVLPPLGIAAAVLRLSCHQRAAAERPETNGELTIADDALEREPHRLGLRFGTKNAPRLVQ